MDPDQSKMKVDNFTFSLADREIKFTLNDRILILNRLENGEFESPQRSKMQLNQQPTQNSYLNITWHLKQTQSNFQLLLMCFRLFADPNKW